MQKLILTLLMLAAPSAMAQIAVPALWYQELSRLAVSDAQGGYFIVSDISTRKPHGDSDTLHSATVRASAWNKPFSSTVEPSHDSRKRL